MRKWPIEIAWMLTLVVAGAAVASDIYKWTDEDGNVHYGDRPEGEQLERVDIDSRPTDQNRIQEMAQARVTARAEAVLAKAAALAAAPSREELQAEKEERERNCAISRQRMQQLISSRRLYREDANGERVYLDDDERLAARENVEKLITRYCPS
jgi:uncharacterized protein DUF4124